MMPAIAPPISYAINEMPSCTSVFNYYTSYPATVTMSSWMIYGEPGHWRSSDADVDRKLILLDNILSVVVHHQLLTHYTLPCIYYMFLGADSYHFQMRFSWDALSEH
jgi:hypothetical protein